MRYKRAILVLLAAVGSGALATRAGLRGSGHDFSGAAWNTGGEMCQPCHTPHHAHSEIDGQEAAFLWNHTFPVNDDFTTDGGTNYVLGAASLACLSCHDGVTALDAYGVHSGTPGNVMPGDPGTGVNVGRDLRGDHPVGAKYGTSTRRRQSVLSGSTWVVKAPTGVGTATATLRLSGSSKTTARVECTTCHTPHDNQYGDFLRMSNAGSLLCAGCHTVQYDGTTSVYVP